MSETYIIDFKAELENSLNMSSPRTNSERIKSKF
jgi:hypothetical protein